MVSLTRNILDAGWEFKQVGAIGVPEPQDEFLPVAQFPTNIHLDLMAHNKIPDPFIGLNEYKVQWVGEQKWLYRTFFTVGAALEGEKTVLQFNGLDTFAAVSLNGTKILESENMHRTYRVDVTSTVKENSNVLEILFDSAIIRGKNLMKERDFKPVGITSGATDKSRLLVRKATYHYSWNWGPELTTCGPWRPIYLERYISRISDLSTKVSVSVLDETASVCVSAEVENGKGNHSISFTIIDPDQNVIATEVAKISDSGLCSVQLKVQDAAFWWPIGLGKQPLYTVRAKLIRESKSLHERERKIGLRSASIIQRPLIDTPGTTFFVEVNNVPVFSSGSNWCPADHFVPRVTAQRYRKLLKIFIAANQNMIRIWGGGVYEEDIFYDICDELGILVWNDFMFACGTYPADAAFQKEIVAEVENNLKRLRHHPSIVAWSGNNEDYLFATLFKAEYDINDTNPENWLKSNFPARYIYEKVLPELCTKLIPDTSYHPGSPWGGKYFNDPTVGDTHMWEGEYSFPQLWDLLWHHISRPWQEYPKLGSRFVSEFGITSLPHVKTIESYLVDSPASERHPHSRTVDHHNKELQHERKLATYLIENFKYGFGLEEYIYISQLNQAEAMTCAMRAWRREWKGPGREYCGGALIWQFNPTWQVTSKALVDYYNRPKMAYFTVKRDIAPISLGIERKEIKKPQFEFTRAFIDKETRFLGWATNVTMKPVTYSLTVKVFELSTGRDLMTRVETRELAANISTELFDLELPKSRKSTEEPLIISTCLRTLSDNGNEGTVVARCTNWPQPYRYLNMPKPKLDICVHGDIVTAKANVPVKGFTLYVEDVDGVEFEDNCLDLVPGDTQAVVSHGLNGRAVTWRYYGME
ncbi:Beta-mannosidase B [Lachnellula subtilissima]|uniref:Beta-mannosidase B n=1 Tax=Lachnellula subtilissima TaxID=602034 RepID=A0A8H8RK57_9HELO|nr:Beta-mannosidase B [Lachnellula subtilissima]